MSKQCPSLASCTHFHAFTTAHSPRPTKGMHTHTHEILHASDFSLCFDGDSHPPERGGCLARPIYRPGIWTPGQRAKSREATVGVNGALESVKAFHPAIVIVLLLTLHSCDIGQRRTASGPTHHTLYLMRPLELFAVHCFATWIKSMKQ